MKCFQSRIVVPIRMQRKLKGLATEGFDYIGFISADSQIPSAFRKNKIEYYANFLRAFADMLYLYFDKFIVNRPISETKKIIITGEEA